MKAKYYTLGMVLFGIGGWLAYSLPAGKNGQSYQPRTKETQFRTGAAHSAAGAFEYYKTIKRNIETGEIEAADLLASAKAVEEKSMAKGAHSAIGMKWENMGPDNVGGRTRAIVVDKDNPNLLIAGGVSGGLWKSTTAGTSWQKISGSDLKNINIGSMHQASDGTIYMGTGEDIMNTIGNGNSGFVGAGMFKSTDRGTTWTKIESTTPGYYTGTGSVSTGDDWSFVTEIASVKTAPTTVYVSTRKGIRKTTDGGETWVNPMTASNVYQVNLSGNALIGAPSGISYDVDVASDGSIIAAVNNRLYLSTDGGSTWVSMHNGTGITNMLPSSPGWSRVSVDFAPSDPNYIYVLTATGAGAFGGVYRSTDKGVTWTQFIPAHASLDVFGGNNQGWYDNILRVHPTDKEFIFCGGVDLWSYSPTSTFERISMWFGDSPTNPYWVHADQHEITFHPTDPNIVYFGNDGGVFKSVNLGKTFQNTNRNYITTQFYGVSFTPYGEVMGGLQDNGTQYINFKGNTSKSAIEVKGGDGFQTDMSWLNPKAYFATSYGSAGDGAVVRSSNSGESFASCLTARPKGAIKSIFHVRIALFEQKTQADSHDTLYYTATSAISAGQTVNVNSKTANTPFSWVADANYAAGDVVAIPDPTRALFLIAAPNALYGTLGALNFSTSPAYARIAGPASGGNDGVSGTPSCFAMSPDGKHLFFGTESGNLYRVSNLNTFKNNRLRDTLSGEVGNAACALTVRRLGSFPKTVCGIAMDPGGSGKLIVTLGDYSATATPYVYRSKSTVDVTAVGTSTGTANFDAIQGDLPHMPVYDVMIDYQDANKVLVGTEYGVYGTTDEATWSEENSGMDRVSVFRIRQQQRAYNECWNSGVVYIGTHGRGIFKSNTLVGMKENAKAVSNVQFAIYPNPVAETGTVSFNLDRKRDVSIDIYDIQGRVVKSYELDEKPAGNHQFTFEASELRAGTYVLNVNGGDDYKKITKFVVTK